MAIQNAINLSVANNADGFEAAGGTTARKLKVIGADITLTGTGSSVYTFPASTSTLASQTLSETFTNKTLTSPVISGAGATTAGAHGYDATNKALLVGDGSANASIYTSAWKAWTPSWTNLTVGAGTNTGAYCVIGKTIHFRFYWKFGAGAAVGTTPTVTLPVTAQTYGSSSTIICTFRGKSGGTGFIGEMFLSGALFALVTNGVYGDVGGITATAPGTWTTNDEIYAAGTYEAS